MPGDAAPKLERGAAWPDPGGEGIAGPDPFAPQAAPADLPGPDPSAAGAPATAVAEPALSPSLPLASQPVAVRRKTGPVHSVGPLSAIPTRGRLQAFLANAVSLAVMLAVAGGLLLWWRGEGRGLRADGGPVAAVQVSSGFYQTERGGQILFVRGRVRSRSAKPLGRVLVRAEIVRAGEVLATSQGLAGAVPTPEELAGLGGREDEERLRARLAARAAERLGPGESAPFLLTVAEVPRDLAGAGLRVVAEPVASGSARAP